jgi:hypothetical protein
LYHNARSQKTYSELITRGCCVSTYLPNFLMRMFWFRVCVCFVLFLLFLLLLYISVGCITGIRAVKIARKQTFIGLFSMLLFLLLLTSSAIFWTYFSQCFALQWESTYCVYQIIAAVLAVTCNYDTCNGRSPANHASPLTITAPAAALWPCPNFGYYKPKFLFTTQSRDEDRFKYSPHGIYTNLKYWSWKGGKNSVRMNHTYKAEISDKGFIRVSCKT